MTDTSQNTQGSNPEQESDDAVDVEESGAGYGNHGDARQGTATGGDESGQGGVSGGMSDDDRG